MAGVSKSFPFPPDLLAVAEALEQCEVEAQSVLTGLTDEHVNWRPESGSWSIGQCLDHLAKTNVVYTAAMRESVAKASEKLNAGDRSWERKGPVQPGWAGLWFLRQLEPPVRVRMPSARFAEPLESFRSTEVMDAYVRSHEPVRALLREARGLDLNRLRFRNPMSRLIRWTVGTGLLIIPAHDRRHIWQMKQVRANSAFPSAPAPALV
jgi:hypothetical protein